MTCPYSLISSWLIGDALNLWCMDTLLFKKSLPLLHKTAMAYAHYLPQWAAERTQYWPRSAPPQLWFQNGTRSCLNLKLLWKDACHGQAPTCAVVPPMILSLARAGPITLTTNITSNNMLYCSRNSSDQFATSCIWRYQDNDLNCVRSII